MAGLCECGLQAKLYNFASSHVKKTVTLADRLHLDNDDVSLLDERMYITKHESS